MHASSPQQGALWCIIIHWGCFMQMESQAAAWVNLPHESLWMSKQRCWVVCQVQAAAHRLQRCVTPSALLGLPLGCWLFRLTGKACN
jgi:hypothetical protein